MRVLIAALVLGSCAWSTHVRSLDWRSDEAIWTAAHRTAPDLARPVLNLATAEERSGQWHRATTHFLLARRLYSADPYVPVYVGRGLASVSVLGQTDICERPSVRPWCVWE